MTKGVVPKLSEAKMNLHKFAKKIYQINVTLSKKNGAEWNHNSPITSTWADYDVCKYFDVDTTFELNEPTWWDAWKDKRNTHLERFGFVPLEIEIFILERTLREHFGLN